MADRATDALERLNEEGGAAHLPETLTSRDVKPLMGNRWYSDQLALGYLPGVQVVAGGRWRCERQTFIDWLTRMRDGERTLGIAGRSGADVSSVSENHS